MRRVLFLAVLCLLGCRDGAYGVASKKNTIPAWREFIQQHPNDENKDAATESLSELEFAEAQRIHTVVAYKRFLDEFPDSAKVGPARALLEGLRFNTAKSKGGPQALRQFLRDHPDGAHRDEAEELLRLAELKEVTALDDPGSLKAIAAAHPDDARGAQAAGKLDDQAFAAGQTATDWFAYLRDFPSGTHRDEARIKLLDAQLQGLIVSGLLVEAKALVAKAPLAPRIPKLAERLARASQLETAASAKDEAVQRVLPQFYLRSFDDVVKSLAAPDPLERWQAAEELGEHVTIRAIDPLLEAFRTSRNPLVRQRAFESLGKLLKALPRPVAEYEVATRVETARDHASDAQLYLTIGVLLDLSGRLDKAASEYQRAFDPAAPDPIVLRRWAQIRRERRQQYSAAVTARQLSLWAQQVAGLQQVSENGSALGVARQLCAAVELSRYAREVIADVAKEPSEFPDDIVEFQRRADDAVKLSEARLRDAELKVLETDALVKRCGDQSVKDRLKEGEQQRLKSIGALPAKVASLVKEAALQREPSPAIRAALSAQ
jgi:tetratricopeptide (TPR) repeat protein